MILLQQYVTSVVNYVITYFFTLGASTVISVGYRIVLLTRTFNLRIGSVLLLMERCFQCLSAKRDMRLGLGTGSAIFDATSADSDVRVFRSTVPDVRC